MSGTSDPQAWQARLAEASAPLRHVHTVRALARVDSTQDAARRLALRGGEVIVALCQEAGRGRLGRSWVDGKGEGIAMTLVLDGQYASLGVAVGVGVASAAAELTDGAVGIKWPNDVLLAGRKLAGVLIETSGDRARVGVGLNVNQTAWPPELAGRAVSLRQGRGNGTELDRAAVVASILRHVDRSLDLPVPALMEAFARRDVLAGRRARFRIARRGGAEEVQGLVVGLDPVRGLVVAPGDGGPRQWLPAALTSVLEVHDSAD